MRYKKTILTKNAIEWLNLNNISSSNIYGEIRFKPGMPIFSIENLKIEPFTGFYGGNNFFEQGYMSYSHSNYPLDTRVGRYCSLGEKLSVIRFNHPTNYISTSIFTYDKYSDLIKRAYNNSKVNEKEINLYDNPQRGAIIIGNDVWIGQNVTLSSGIKIGSGAIIGANSVVTKDIMPYQVVVGNPAKVIKMRFNNKIIEKLLHINWWDYNFLDFNGLDYSSVEHFLDQFSEIKDNLDRFIPKKIDLNDFKT